MKRRIAIILLLLAGGAIVNVAVAWGCVIQRRAMSFENLTTSVVHSGSRMWRGLVERYEFELPSQTRYTFHTESGWPVLSVGSLTHVDFGNGAPATRSYDGVVIASPRGTWPEIQFPKVLPLRPIWLGFVINTVIYACFLGVLIWFVFATITYVLQAIRRRRGQCEKCAYPIGTSEVCTECGAALPRKVET